MKFTNGVLLVFYIFLAASTITLGYPMKSFSEHITPFGDCKVFQIGATKKVTETRDFLHEARLAYFPKQDGEEAFSIEIHVTETIFRLTLTRTTISLDKCNYISKRCTVEQETRTERNDYIIPRTWNIVNLQVHYNRMSIHIGPTIVYNVTFSDYPPGRISWLVRNRQVMDHKTKKEIAMFGDQIKYLVQFMCEENEAKAFTSPSTTELISFTNYITESIQSTDYEYDYNDVASQFDADELKDTTLVTIPSSFYPKFTNKEFHQKSTLDPGYFAEYDLYDTTADSTTELPTSNYFFQTEYLEKNHTLLLSFATPPEPKLTENEKISTIVDSTSDTTLVSNIVTHPPNLGNFGISITKPEVEDYEDYLATSPVDVLHTTTSITDTWTVSPELPKKTFDSLYVVIIAGLLAGIFIVLTFIVYCVMRKRHSVPISENVLPEDQTSNIC